MDVRQKFVRYGLLLFISLSPLSLLAEVEAPSLVQYGGHQTIFINRATIFLAQKIKETTSEDERNHFKLMIEKFKNSLGVCQGITTVWLHAKVVDEDSSSASKEKIRDDSKQFFHILKLLEDWDGKTKFSKEQDEEIYNFIAQIDFYQDSYKELLKSDANIFLGPVPLHKTMYDSKRGFPKELLHTQVVATKERLVRVFEQLIRPGAMIMLAVSNVVMVKGLANHKEMKDLQGVIQDGHALGIYQDVKTKKFYFYNSNADKEEKEKEFETVEALVDDFWKDTREYDKSFVAQSLFRILNIRIFEFTSEKLQLSKYYSQFREIEDIIPEVGSSLEEISTFLMDKNFINIPVQNYLEKRRQILLNRKKQGHMFGVYHELPDYMEEVVNVVRERDDKKLAEIIKSGRIDDLFFRKTLPKAIGISEPRTLWHQVIENEMKKSLDALLENIETSSYGFQVREKQYYEIVQDLFKYNYSLEKIKEVVIKFFIQHDSKSSYKLLKIIPQHYMCSSSDPKVVKECQKMIAHYLNIAPGQGLLGKHGSLLTSAIQSGSSSVESIQEFIKAGERLTKEQARLLFTNENENRFKNDPIFQYYKNNKETIIE